MLENKLDDLNNSCIDSITIHIYNLNITEAMFDATVHELLSRKMLDADKLESYHLM